MGRRGRARGSRQEGSLYWVKNHRRMLDYQQRKAEDEVQFADADRVGPVRRRFGLALVNRERQKTKKRQLDEDGVAALDSGREVHLDKYGKIYNDALRGEEARKGRGKTRKRKSAASAGGRAASAASAAAAPPDASPPRSRSRTRKRRRADENDGLQGRSPRAETGAAKDARRFAASSEPASASSSSRPDQPQKGTWLNPASRRSRRYKRRMIPTQAGAAKKLAAKAQPRAPPGQAESTSFQRLQKDARAEPTPRAREAAAASAKPAAASAKPMLKAQPQCHAQCHVQVPVVQRWPTAAELVWFRGRVGSLEGAWVRVVQGWVCDGTRCRYITATLCLEFSGA